LGNPKYEPRTFIHPRTGKPTTMNTGNIGRSAPPLPEPPRTAPQPRSAEPEPAWTPADVPLPFDVDPDPVEPPPDAEPAAHAGASFLGWEIEGGPPLAREAQQHRSITER
jgi:hypothetical protein